MANGYETGHCDGRRTVQRMDTVDGHAIDPLVAPIAGDTMKTLNWLLAAKTSDLTVKTVVGDPIVATVCEDDSLGLLEVPVQFNTSTADGFLDQTDDAIIRVDPSGAASDSIVSPSTPLSNLADQHLVPDALGPASRPDLIANLVITMTAQPYRLSTLTVVLSNAPSSGTSERVLVASTGQPTP